MLGLMSHAIIRSIIEQVQQADYFTIMIDECVDVSSKEQLTICIRYVDPDLEVHEEFIGLYLCPNIKADTIVSVLKDVLVRLNLDLSRCRGQCYDGSSNMAGARNGVKTQILMQEPRALFTHCYGHALSLAVADSIKSVKVLQSVMDTTHEISKLFQYSPKRQFMFKKVKADISPDTMGFRILCPTRWTVRNETFQSIHDNYEVILELWETILEECLDSETRARVNGVSSQMRKFEYFFGANLVLIILKHTDNLSKTLQKTKMSASEGQVIAKMTVSTLQVNI